MRINNSYVDVNTVGTNTLYTSQVSRNGRNAYHSRSEFVTRPGASFDLDLPVNLFCQIK